MKLESIALRNFLSHHETNFCPGDARLVTIVGSNGAGKSSLLDGMAYALFDAARGRTDDLLTLGQTDMSVRVEFTYAGARYAVTRGRTAKAGGKSYLELAVDDPARGMWIPLTGDSIRETQAKINDLLRVDAEAFAAAVLLAQGKMDAFAEAGGTARKGILSTAIGLDIYPRAEAEAKARAVAQENQLANGRAEAERLDAELQAVPELEADLIVHREAIAHHTSEVEGFTAARAAAVSGILGLATDLAALAGAGAELERIDAELAQLRTDWAAAGGRARIAQDERDRAKHVLTGESEVVVAIARAATLHGELETQLATQRAYAAYETEIRTRRAAIEAAAYAQTGVLAAYQADLRNATRDVDRLVEAQTSLKPITCPKCGAEIRIDQADIAGTLKAARAHLAELEAAPPKGNLTVERERGSIERMEIKQAELGYDPAILTGLHAEAAAVAATAARGELIEASRALVATSTEAIAQAATERAAIDDRGKSARWARGLVAERIAGGDELRAMKLLLDERQAMAEEQLKLEQRALTISSALEARDSDRLVQLADVGRRREVLEEGMAALTRDAGRLRKLSQAFGVTGIPTRIIEGVLPELTEHAQALLDDLRPGLTLELRAQRAKKDGKGLIEALDLIVRDDAGERPLAMFSGGERMSVSLAIAVGLSRLIARRAGTALRTLVIDEPDGLDAEARRAFGQALRMLAHQGELERVLLVSHHEDLAEVGDSQYRVTKTDHGSVVTQL